MTYFTARSNLETCVFLWEKVKTVDCSETIAASDLKVGRCRQLIKVKVIFLSYIFQVLYVLRFTRPRYQVSIYRTIGPLLIFSFGNFT